MIDKLTKMGAAISMEHNRTHENQLCISQVYDAALVDSGLITMYLKISVAKKVHLRILTELVGDGLLTILKDESANVVLETAIPVIVTYSLDIVTGTIETKLYSAVASGAESWGSRLVKLVAGGAGASPAARNSSLGQLEEVILGQGTQWKITFQNLSGATSQAQLLLGFYTYPRDTSLTAPIDNSDNF